MEASEMNSIPAAILAEAQRQHAILSRGTAAIYPGPDRHGLDGLHYKLAKSVGRQSATQGQVWHGPDSP
jgi:hypothetical protein